MKYNAKLHNTAQFNTTQYIFATMVFYDAIVRVPFTEWRQSCLWEMWHPLDADILKSSKPIFIWQIAFESSRDVVLNAFGFQDTDNIPFKRTRRVWEMCEPWIIQQVKAY